jgi:hypothetical protein
MFIFLFDLLLVGLRFAPSAMQERYGPNNGAR